VVPESNELRRAVLTGPFFAPDTDSTYTLVLDRYGQQVDISAPPTS
jgi:lipoprotein LprG